MRPSLISSRMRFSFPRESINLFVGSYSEQENCLLTLVCKNSKMILRSKLALQAQAPASLPFNLWVLKQGMEGVIRQ